MKEMLDLCDRPLKSGDIVAVGWSGGGEKSCGPINTFRKRTGRTKKKHGDANVKPLTRQKEYISNASRQRFEWFRNRWNRPKR